MTQKPITTKAAPKQRTKFTVPVFPHIKKFILKTYGQAEPVKVEEYNSLGKMVTLALRDNRTRADHNDQQRDRVTATITIILGKEQTELGPRIGKLMRINNHVDVLFKEHLLIWIHALKADGIAPFTACKMFLEFYGIDEKEYSLDAAYKYYQRNN